MPKIIAPRNFEDWLQLRSYNISSTESAALFGMSPYLTLYELWYQKKQFRDAGELFTLEDNERMMVGRNVEDAIAKIAMEQLDIKARRLKTYMRHSVVPGMGSSFDYEIISHPDGPGILEIKNVDYFVYRNEWTADEAPPHIEIQVQHQLEVIDREWAIICPLVGGNSLKPIYRERDRKVGQAIINKISNFWKAMDAGIQPDPDYQKDAELLIKIYSDDSGEVVDISDDDRLQAMVMTYDTLRKRYNDIEKATKTIKAEILDKVGNAAGLITDYGMKVNLSRTKDTPSKTITESMVGQEFGGRQGYRQFRVLKTGK